MTWYGIGTVAAGILSAIVLVGAATAAGVRLSRYRLVQKISGPFCRPVVVIWRGAAEAWTSDREERFVERVRPIIRDEVSVLMKPNGGNSVADVAQAVRALRSELTEHLRQADRRDERIDQLAADIGALTDPTTED